MGKHQKLEGTGLEWDGTGSAEVFQAKNLFYNMNKRLIKNGGAVHSPRHVQHVNVQWVCEHFLSGLTDAESRRDAHTQQILVDHEHTQEETVFGPDPGNNRPPPPHQDGHQPTAVDDHQEVHPLANHVHRHQKANLRRGGPVLEE